MTETLLTAWREARARLTAAGVDSPALDARMLLERAAGVTRMEILTDPYRALTSAQRERLAGLLLRREAREPISHILGQKAFWTLELQVTPDVLTPRPETEFLVQAALDQAPKDTPLSILDLGVGSGAILLAILAERPQASGVGLDASPAALAVAEANAKALGFAERVRLVEGDWAGAPTGPFDLIVTNPPYIPSGELAGLQPEVALYEPHLALEGGADGLDAYRAIAPLLASRLTPRGYCALEVGAGQAPSVQTLLTQAGLSVKEVRNDLAGHGRVVVAQA